MPCSPAKVNRRFRGTYLLHFRGQGVSSAYCLLHAVFFLGLLFDSEMEVTYCSEMSVDFHRIKRRYTPEDRILHIHRCDNLKSNMVTILYIVQTKYFGHWICFHRDVAEFIPHICERHRLTPCCWRVQSPSCLQFLFTFCLFSIVYYFPLFHFPTCP
jgi:hypothetical protein